MYTQYKCICFKHHFESDHSDNNVCSLPNIHRGLGPLTKLTLRNNGQSDPEVLRTLPLEAQAC